jgi:hypothetical protein
MGPDSKVETLVDNQTLVDNYQGGRFNRPNDVIIGTVSRNFGTGRAQSRFRFSQRSIERADSMTRQPSAANALAVANPMPRLEPVTRAALPRSLRSMTQPP